MMDWSAPVLISTTGCRMVKMNLPEISRHINGIKSSLRFAKRRPAKFNGVPEHTFYLHLKET